MPGRCAADRGTPHACRPPQPSRPHATHGPPAWLGSSQLLRCMAHSVCSLVAMRYFSSPSPAGGGGPGASIHGTAWRSAAHSVEARRGAAPRRGQARATLDQRARPRRCQAVLCSGALRCTVHPPVTLYSSSSNWLSCAHSAITGFCGSCGVRGGVGWAGLGWAGRWWWGGVGWGEERVRRQAGRGGRERFRRLLDWFPELQLAQSSLQGRAHKGGTSHGGSPA